MAKRQWRVGNKIGKEIMVSSSKDIGYRSR